jgi:hypothetical protein
MQATNHDKMDKQSSATEEELHRSRSVSENIKLFNGGKEPFKRSLATPDQNRSYAADSPVLTKTINLNTYREPTVNSPVPEKAPRKLNAVTAQLVEDNKPGPITSTPSVRKPALAPRPVMRTGSTQTSRPTPPAPPPRRLQNSNSSLSIGNYVDTPSVPSSSPAGPSFPPRPTTPSISKPAGITSPSLKPQQLHSSPKYETKGPPSRSNSDPKSPNLKSGTTEKSAWSPPSMSSVSNVASTTTSVLKGTFDKFFNGVNDLLVTAQGSTTGASLSSSSSAPNKNLISSPYNLMHITHVGFNQQTGEFTGLPKEWQILLNSSGITRREQEANPQAVLDAITFYKESREEEEDDEEVWQKFELAQSRHPPRLPNPSLISQNQISEATSSRPPPLPKRHSRPRIVVVNTNQLSSMTPISDKPGHGSKPPPIPSRPNLNAGKAFDTDKVIIIVDVKSDIDSYHTKFNHIVQTYYFHVIIAPVRIEYNRTNESKCYKCKRYSETIGTASC